MADLNMSPEQAVKMLYNAADKAPLTGEEHRRLEAIGKTLLEWIRLQLEKDAAGPPETISD